MKKYFILIFGFLLFTGTVFGQGLNKKIESIDFKKIDSVKTKLENSIKFLNLLDSNKEAKQEYLLSLRHSEKSRKDILKSIKGLGAFVILGSVSINQDNDAIGIASFGVLTVAYFYNISALIHSIKSKKHLKKAYKIIGLNPPKFRD